MQSEKQKRDSGFSSAQALIIGFILVTPLIILSTITHLQPLSNVFSRAQTEGNLMRDPEFVGNENYDRLFEDDQFGQVIGNTLPYVILRIIIATVIPALVGGLIGVQARFGRTLNRLLLSIIAVLIVPIALATLWRVYWGPFWGLEVSPVYNEAFALNSVEGATLSLQWLDTLIVVAVAAVVGGTVFIAVMRGKNRLLAGIGVTMIGMIIAGASAFLIFDVPYTLTGGGPGISTTTYMLDVYQSGFQMLRMGYASAQVSFLGIGAVVVGGVIGILSIGFNLRLVQSPREAQNSGQNGFSLLSVPILIAILIPLAGLVLWGNNLALQNEAFGQINESFHWTLASTIATIPWFAIWFVQIPITLMAGLALGFFRPFGRVGSNILFVILLMITIIPTEVLIFEWFIMARDMALLNEAIVLGLPWLINGFTLLVFKVLFDGAHESFHRAIESGESRTIAFSNRVMLPGFLMALVLGIVMSFISLQSFSWSIVSQSTRENFTPLVGLFVQSGFSPQLDQVTGAASQIIWWNVIIFVVLFGFMQIFILDRFKLEAGWGHQGKDKPKSEFVDDHTDFDAMSPHEMMDWMESTVDDDSFDSGGDDGGYSSDD